MVQAREAAEADKKYKDQILITDKNLSFSITLNEKLVQASAQANNQYKIIL